MLHEIIFHGPLLFIDSPGIPRIFNEGGEEIKRGYVGPLSLGSNMSLICEVDDGRSELNFL